MKNENDNSAKAISDKKQFLNSQNINNENQFPNGTNGSLSIKNLNLNEKEDLSESIKIKLILKLTEIQQYLNSPTDHNNLLKFYSKKYLSEIFDVIRDTIYYKLENIKVADYIELLISIIDNFLLPFKNEENIYQPVILDLISSIESLIYLFLFHFEFEVISLAYKLLNVLLDEVDFDFHIETLQKIIKILHILKSKKTVNNIVCNKIISNLSLAIMIIMHNTNGETRKCLLDFITSNNEDYVFMWILCGACTNELNYSKFFPVESNLILIEKNTKEIDKHNKNLEMCLQNLKTEKSLTLKNKIKGVIDIMGCVCKLIDSFHVTASKTYNYDKIIKNNLIPAVKKFWNSVLFIQDAFFFEIDFSIDSIITIITLTENLDSLQFDLLLPLLNWTAMLLEKNIKYIVVLKLIVRLFSKCNIPEETSEEIVSVILQILEKSIASTIVPASSVSNSNSNSSFYNDAVLQYYVLLILDELGKFPNLSNFVITEDTKMCFEFFNSIGGKDVIDDSKENNIENNNLRSNCEIYTKEYKEIISDSLITDVTFKKPTFNKANKNINKLYHTTLSKYEEFKNSLKSLYNLESSNLLVDNKIINFMEKEDDIFASLNKDTNLINQTYENFYLETTIDMYKEIFNYQNPQAQDDSNINNNFPNQNSQNSQIFQNLLNKK